MALVEKHEPKSVKENWDSHGILSVIAVPVVLEMRSRYLYWFCHMQYWLIGRYYCQHHQQRSFQVGDVICKVRMVSI